MAGDCLFMAGYSFKNLPSQPETVSCLQPYNKTFAYHVDYILNFLQKYIIVLSNQAASPKRKQCVSIK